VRPLGAKPKERGPHPLGKIHEKGNVPSEKKKGFRGKGNEKKPAVKNCHLGEKEFASKVPP